MVTVLGLKKKVEFNLGDNQLLVKIFYSGVCRSQIMEQLGYRDNHKYLPHFLGHEGIWNSSGQRK